MSEETSHQEQSPPTAQDAKLGGILPELETAADAPADANANAGEVANKAGSQSIDAMLNVGMNIQIVLGYSKMPIADLLKLSRGSVIELDKRIGEPVDVVINQSLVARGDLIKVGEDRIGISLTEIVKDYILES